MIQKPKQYRPEYAEAFKYRSVAEAYRYRPPYPAEVFDILARLVTKEPRRVLDVGCGTGNIARHLVEHVGWVDAVDFSQNMIERGRQLPHGDHPRLRWLHGRIEDVVLEPSYALVTAGESLHWMDWNVVLPRFRELLVPEGYLAIVDVRTTPDPWSTLGTLIESYRTDGGYQPYNMVEELQRHGLLTEVHIQNTASVPFVQSIDEFIESYHSRSGFSRERMGAARAEAFDQEARSHLMNRYHDGIISLQTVGHIVWGVPGMRPQFGG